MVKQIFMAQDGNITLGGTDVTAEIREINVTGGGRDVVGVRAFGSGTNAFLNEQPQELFETSITYIKSDLDFAGFLMGGSDGVEPIAYAGDQPRASGFLNKALIYNLTDNTDSSGAQLRITFASVYGVSKEMRMTTTDFLEETFTFKLLPKDYKEEYTSDRITSPLA